MNNNHRWCVIMCGGIGSRFWPYSRISRPKQFIDFFGTGRTLFQLSYDRVAQFVPEDHILVVTNESYLPMVREQLPTLPPEQILFEPARRNTAPCIAWAAWHIAAIDPEATMIVTPSDHIITREYRFLEAVERGFDFVENHHSLLVVGVKPNRPETGYGYIQIGNRDTDDIYRVKTFTEKPAEDIARVFVDSGEFFWNSGIFLWKASSIKRELLENAPDVAAVFERGAEYFGTPAEVDFIKRTFPGCMSISIDMAVMEKAKHVYVETADFGWNDLGTWRALYDLSPKNNAGNVTQNCNVLQYNSSGNILAIEAEGKLVVLDGLHNFIVADTDDVLLICPKASEQRIRQVVNDVNLNFGEKYS